MGPKVSYQILDPQRLMQTIVYKLFTLCFLHRLEKNGVVTYIVADPGSGAFLTLGSGMVRKSGSGSGMSNSDHISDSLETIFWVKILKFFDAGSGIENSDPGSGLEKVRIGDPV
jgi:hypothetical protein